MEYVCNANFKGEYDKKIDLRALPTSIPKSKLCIKPYQLVIKDLCGTLILFSNGKFRTMGCIDELEASLFACSYLEKLSKFEQIPFITLQSYTMKYELGYRVSLEKMSADIDCVYEPELFPALRLKEHKPISVNLFTTGKVMVCGIKEPDRIYDIIMHIRWLCEFYKL